MRTRFLARDVLPDLRRCGRQNFRLGLEEHPTADQLESARQCVHERTLASARDQQSSLLFLGPDDQALGLDGEANEVKFPADFEIFIRCHYSSMVNDH